MCRARERPRRVADVAMSHCYVTVVVPRGKSLLSHLLSPHLAPSLVLPTLGRAFGSIVEHPSSFRIPAPAPRVKCMRRKKCAHAQSDIYTSGEESSIRRKRRRCLPFKVPLSRARGLRYEIQYDTRTTVIGRIPAVFPAPRCDSYFSVFMCDI